MDLSDADVTDILALLDSLPYDELDLETSRFRLTLRRTPHGWTQSTEVLSARAPVAPAPLETTAMEHRGRSNDTNVPSLSLGAGMGQDSGEADGVEEAGGDKVAETGDAGGELVAETGDAEGELVAETGDAEGELVAETGDAEGELVAVAAPLPGTFYRAPRPGAAPFVDVGSRVSADTVIGIVETMKLMNSVHAGVAGTVAEFCVQNAEFAAHGSTLLRIRADQ